MTEGVTAIAGIEIPSTSPVFLIIVGFHILLGLTCVVTGLVAMMSPKGRGRHSNCGTVYYWCLSAVFASATALSAMRWAENYHLFAIGALSFGTALLGRAAARQPQPRRRFDLHVTGMGLSYIFLLTAFYVDNGKNLPLWKELPAIVLWLLPAVVGIPIIVRVLLRHPLLRQPRN
ncbi:MAG TPA: hypothetical protein VFV69_09670 [Steroidobacteraceae bacterium]|nr:hypothetical protein [Steroidobacteraceae bacterium]